MPKTNRLAPYPGLETAPTDHAHARRAADHTETGSGAVAGCTDNGPSAGVVRAREVLSNTLDRTARPQHCPRPAPARPQHYPRPAPARPQHRRRPASADPNTAAARASQTATSPTACVSRPQHCPQPAPARPQRYPRSRASQPGARRARAWPGGVPRMPGRPKAAGCRYRPAGPPRRR
jgi:hypothetical protein